VRIPVALLLLACGTSGSVSGSGAGAGADATAAAEQPAASSLEATPPPAPGPEGEKLYQLLYGGEVGPQAHASGQRARMLAWLASMDLSEAQLRGLLALVDAAAAKQAEDQATMQALGAQEQAFYTPVYQQLVQLYASGEPVQDAQLAPLAAQLEQARAQVQAQGDARAAHFRRVAQVFALAQAWAEGLTADQRSRLGQARFFLGRELGPFVNPGDYADFLGTTWAGGDFGSLRATLRPADEGQMDIGGLWSAERVQGAPEHELQSYQLTVILMFAVQSEGLRPAIEVRLGQRPPLDFGP